MRLRTIRSKLSLGMGGVIIGFILLSLMSLGLLTRSFATREITRSLVAGKDAFDRFINLRFELLRGKARSIARTPYLRATLTIEELDQATAFQAAQQVFQDAETPLLVLLDAQGSNACGCGGSVVVPRRSRTSPCHGKCPAGHGRLRSVAPSRQLLPGRSQPRAGWWPAGGSGGRWQPNRFLRRRGCPPDHGT